MFHKNPTSLLIRFAGAFRGNIKNKMKLCRIVAVISDGSIIYPKIKAFSDSIAIILSSRYTITIYHPYPSNRIIRVGILVDRNRCVHGRT
jgi:hypothetical protein